MKRRNKPLTKQRKRELKALTETPAYNLLDKFEKQLVWDLISSKSIWIEDEETRKPGEIIRAYLPPVPHPHTPLWKYDICFTWYNGLDNNMAKFLGIYKSEGA